MFKILIESRDITNVTYASHYGAALNMIASGWLDVCRIRVIKLSFEGIIEIKSNL